MAWVASTIALWLLCYLVVFGSLLLACRMLKLRGVTTRRVLLAAVLPAAVVGIMVYSQLFLNLDALSALPSAIFLLPPFVSLAVSAMLLGAPWFLRARDVSWGRAFAAALSGGALLSVIGFIALILALPGMSFIAQERSLQQAAVIVQADGLPVYAGKQIAIEERMDQRRLISARDDPFYRTYQPERWIDRWPYNDRLRIYPNGERETELAFYRTGLEQAGFAVKQWIEPTCGTELKPGRDTTTYLCGYRPGLMVLYTFEQQRFTCFCYVLIWRDFADAMEPVCAAAASQAT